MDAYCSGVDYWSALDELRRSGVQEIYVDALPPAALVVLRVDPALADFLPAGSPPRLSAALHLVAALCRQSENLPRWIPLSEIRCERGP